MIGALHVKAYPSREPPEFRWTCIRLLTLPTSWPTQFLHRQLASAHDFLSHRNETMLHNNPQTCLVDYSATIAACSVSTPFWCYFPFFFLLPPNLDASQPLSLTLLHHRRTELTPKVFHSSFNLVPHSRPPYLNLSHHPFHVRSYVYDRPPVCMHIHRSLYVHHRALYMINSPQVKAYLSREPLKARCHPPRTPPAPDR